MSRFIKTLAGVGPTLALARGEPAIANNPEGQPAPHVSEANRIGQLAVINYTWHDTEYDGVTGTNVVVNYQAVTDLFNDRLYSAVYIAPKTPGEKFYWDELFCTGGDRARFVWSYYPGIVEAKDNDIAIATGKSPSTCHNGPFSSKFKLNVMTHFHSNPPKPLCW
jgi:hypothetical protein